MKRLLWGIPILVGCTLISDADQFVGEGDGGVPDAAEMDAGPDDVGPFTEGSCAWRVNETRNNAWQDSRCCFHDSHCRGMTVGDNVYDGRCVGGNSCGTGGDPSICIPSLASIQEEFTGDRCYLNRDCGAETPCMFGMDSEFATATCGDIGPDPGFCGEPE